MKPILKNLKDFIENTLAKKQRIFIIPTQLGILYTGINFSIFLFGLFYSNNMSLLVSFIMISYFIIAMIITNNELNGLELIYIHINDQYCDLTSKNTILLKSQNLSQYLKITIGSKIKNISIDKNFNTFTIQSNSLKRGVYQFSKIKISTKSSSELFMAWRYYKVPITIYVYPQMIIDEIKTKDYSIDQSYFESNEFDYHIPYQNFHPAKRINWKIYARNEQLFWKKFESISNQTVEFDLRKMTGNLEQRLSKLSYLVTKAHKEKVFWTLRANDVYLKGSGKIHFQNCMRELSKVFYE